MSTPATVLVLAEHDTTLNETVELFQREGFTVHMASGEDNVATWIASFKPSLIAYRLTDPATRRTVCRTTLQAVAALPGVRTPSLALCGLDEATAAASLCKEGLADDYLVVDHLAADVDRLVTVTYRLVALRRQHEQEARQLKAIEDLWRSFSSFDLELQQDLMRADPDGRGAARLAHLRTAHHRARARLTAAPVLVVDDDPDFLALLTTLVSALKQPVVGAQDAAGALDWLENNVPSLILLDYQMPGTDGACLLEWMWQSPRLKGVPVIMLTGQSRMNTVQRVKKLGVVGFIVKPSDPPTIMKKIADHL